MRMWILIALLAAAAGASIYGTADTHRDLRSGTPSCSSIVDFTGFDSPAEVERLLGVPNEDNRYRLTEAEIAALPRRAWVRRFDSVLGDCAAASSAIAGGVVARHAVYRGWALVVAAGVYLVIGYGLAVRVAIQHPRLRD